MREYYVVQRAAACASPQTIRPMASTCRPTIAAITCCVDHPHEGTISSQSIFPGFDSTRTVVSRTSRRTSPSKIYPASIPKRRRPRPRLSGTSSTLSRAPEDAELADVIDALGRPDAVTLTQLIAAAEVRRPPGWWIGKIAAASPTSSNVPATSAFRTLIGMTASGSCRVSDP